MESETTSVLDDEGGLDEDGWLWGVTTRVFFAETFSLVTGFEFFFFWFAWLGSTILLLLVFTGRAYCSLSLSELGRIKSHIPWHSTVSSSSISSADKTVSSSSSSSKLDSALDIALGGLGSVG